MSRGTHQLVRSATFQKSIQYHLRVGCHLACQCSNSSSKQILLANKWQEMSKTKYKFPNSRTGAGRRDKASVSLERSNNNNHHNNNNMKKKKTGNNSRIEWKGVYEMCDSLTLLPLFVISKKHCHSTCFFPHHKGQTDILSVNMYLATGLC